MIQEINAFFIFHDKVFPTYPENHDTKEGFCFLNQGIKTKFFLAVNPLSSSPTKRPNKLRQFIGNLLMNRSSVFDHFSNVKQALGRVVSKKTLHNFKPV